MVKKKLVTKDRDSSPRKVATVVVWLERSIIRRRREDGGKEVLTGGQLLDQ